MNQTKKCSISFFLIVKISIIKIFKDGLYDVLIPSRFKQQSPFVPIDNMNILQLHFSNYSFQILIFFDNTINFFKKSYKKLSICSIISHIPIHNIYLLQRRTLNDFHFNLCFSSIKTTFQISFQQLTFFCIHPFHHQIPFSEELPSNIQVIWAFLGCDFFFHYQYRNMLTRKQNKMTKTICHIREPSRPTQYIAPQVDEEEVVTFQTHSQKMDLNKQAEGQLFEKVLVFLKEFLTNRKLWTEVQERMNKYAKSSERLSSQKKNEKMLSFKKMTFGSRICFDAEVVPKGQGGNQQCKARATRGNNKKISILINQQDFSSSSSEEMFSDDIISETVVRTIRSIEIPRLEMNLETIELIYDTPQPFLIILSLCIFTRYCLSTRKRVKIEESAWVLCVATVIAYKLFYDEEIEGLIDCFTGIMKIQRQDLIDLERCFLEEIDYATVVRNYDYHFIMAKLLSMPIQKRIEEEQSQ